MNYYPNLFAFYRRDGKFSLIIIVPSELGRYNYINGFAEFLLTARGLREAVDAVSRALQFFILLHVHPFFLDQGAVKGGFRPSADLILRCRMCHAPEYKCIDSETLL